jgi:hypothetical protein
MVFRAIDRAALQRAAVAGSVVLGAVLLAGQSVAPAQAVDPVPPALTFLSPLTGSVSTTGKFMVVGTATDPTDTVEVYAWLDGTPESDRTLLCTSAVTVDRATFQNRWGCGEVTLARGNYTISAVSGTSPYITSVTVAVNIPVPVTIDSPAMFSTVYTATPTISGHANPGDVITVMSAFGGSTLCTATTGDDTVWSCTGSALTNGFHNIPVFRGLVHERDVIFTVMIPPAITSPISGSTFTEGTVSFSGTAPPSESIVVRTTEGYDLCAANTKLDGTWACDWIAGSADVGVHSLVAYSSSTMLQSDPITVTITGAPAVTPVIVSPATGESIPVGTVTFSGTAGADESVSVWTTVGGLRTAELCSTTSDSAGDWQCSYDAGSSDVGSHTVVAYTTVESDPVDFTITETPTYPLVVTSPESGSTVTTSTPTVSGTAAPGAEVSITTTEGGEPVCTTVADDSGAWSCTVSKLPEGENTLFVTVDGTTTSLTITVSTSSGGDGDSTVTPELATTGSELGTSFFGLGVALVTFLAGGALLMVRKRRSAEAHK